MFLSLNKHGTAVGLNNDIPIPNEKQGYYILFIHIPKHLSAYFAKSKPLKILQTSF